MPARLRRGSYTQVLNQPVSYPGGKVEGRPEQIGLSTNQAFCERLSRGDNSRRYYRYRRAR